MIPLKDENPARTFPFITISLIAINSVVFIHQFTSPLSIQKEFIFAFGMIPGALLGQVERIPTALPAAATMITSQFIHGGILHLLGNMLYLWIFGNNIEDLLGRFRFLLFYLLCGVLAAVVHIVINPYSDIPMVGASGAIAGVLGAYLITFPKAQVRVLVFIFIFITTMRISAFWVLGFWFIIQIFYATGSSVGGGTNVAYMAHIGGFIAGIWLLRKFRPGLRWKIKR